ncbi:MAG: CBS domain-containing protein [Rhodovibrionaceae bacterium]|nr:CBS domain-containing protein [Rhodovibrionaceae bacterium]
MNVRQLLNSKQGEIAGISPDTPVSEAVAVLRQANVGALVVTDKDGQLIGILSERDIVRSLAEDGGDLMEKKVSDLMTSDVVTCKPQDRIEDLMRQMTEGRFRHLPVVEKGKLTGIVSIGDVVKHRLDELEAEASQLRAYISG